MPFGSLFATQLEVRYNVLPASGRLSALHELKNKKEQRAWLEH